VSMQKKQVSREVEQLQVAKAELEEQLQDYTVETSQQVHSVRSLSLSLSLSLCVCVCVCGWVGYGVCCMCGSI